MTSHPTSSAASAAKRTADKHTAEKHPVSPSKSESRPGFLPEVQALRAVAVLLVVAFHLWPGSVTGGFVGVDVFFGISGFLITGHLLRELTERGRIALGSFWARRIRRLLPAAFLVLGVSAVATLLYLPTTQWKQAFGEMQASALYVQNWHLAFDSVDYFATENAASPVQHYWSLSVEEQFYLVWPVLLAATAGIALFVRHRRMSATEQAADVDTGNRLSRSVIIGITALVTVAAFGYSIHIAATEPGFGYFSTFAHAWEFGLGALIAVGGARITALLRSRPSIAAAASWVGLALILFAGFVYTGGTPFPGSAALLPLLGTVLVILAGQSPARWSPARLVATRPVQYIGDISYSLYLWHWPLIILVPAAVGAPLSFAGKIAVLAASIGAAAVTKVWVEDRFRKVSWFSGAGWRTYLAAAVTTAALVAGCLVPATVISQREDWGEAQAADIESDPCFGAAAMERSGCPPRHEVTAALGPEFNVEDTVTQWLAENIDPAFARDDSENPFCGMVTDTVRQCRFEEPRTDDPFTIAVVGDSHARVLVTPLLIAARERGWEVLMYWNGGCRAAEPGFQSPDAPENEPDCRDWQASVIDHIADSDSIDAVLTSGWTRQYAQKSAPGTDLRPVADALRGAWRTWTDSGKQVVVVPDVPGNVHESVSDCIAKAEDVEDPCALPRSEAAPKDPVDMALAKPQRGVHRLDLTRYFCDAERCHFVVGGVITTRDGHHLSATFANSMLPAFERTLEPLAH